MMKKLNEDIFLDGKKLKPFTIYNVNLNKLNIILIEGKYHQIKRIFQIVDNPVKELKRIRIGKLKLKNLNITEGSYVSIKKYDI